MTHLGTRISALVDGRLTGAERERALCHVAACPACADELAATRAARRALAAACEVAPAPDLTARLLALGAQAACPAGPARQPSTPPPPAGRVPTAPAAGLGGGPVLRSGPVLGTGPVLGIGRGGLDGSVLDAGPFRASARSVALIAAGAVVAGLFLLGEARQVMPDSHPASDLALLASAGTEAGGAVTVAAGGQTGGLAAASSVDPGDAWPGGALPEGYAVVATGTARGGARLDLDGPSGPVVVLREPGVLDGDALADLPTVALGPHEVHVLSVAPWHVVWQSGDAVVGVVAAHRSSAVDDLVAAYPAVRADDGIGARMSRGWQTVVGAWGP